MSMHAVNEYAECAFLMLIQEKARELLLLAIKVAGEMWVVLRNGV